MRHEQPILQFHRHVENPQKKNRSYKYITLMGTQVFWANFRSLKSGLPLSYDSEKKMKCYLGTHFNHMHLIKFGSSASKVGEKNKHFLQEFANKKSKCKKNKKNMLTFSGHI